MTKTRKCASCGRRYDVSVSANCPECKSFESETYVVGKGSTVLFNMIEIDTHVADNRRKK